MHLIAGIRVSFVGTNQSIFEKIGRHYGWY